MQWLFALLPLKMKPCVYLVKSVSIATCMSTTTPAKQHQCQILINHTQREAIAEGEFPSMTRPSNYYAFHAG